MRFGCSTEGPLTCRREELTISLYIASLAHSKTIKSTGDTHGYIPKQYVVCHKFAGGGGGGTGMDKSGTTRSAVLKRTCCFYCHFAGS